jgi:glycosyltransferase involved in cell wall biosynthesis
MKTPLTLSIGIPVLNQFSETARCLKQIHDTAKNFKKIYIVDNGSSPEFVASLKGAKIDSEIINKIVIIRNKKNVGVRPALNQIWKASTEDIIVFTHNDVEFFEPDWDKKVIEAFDRHPQAGIIGAYGAKGLGSNDIYEEPYQIMQLARGGNVSNCIMNMNVHGFRKLQAPYENVAVFDGFFMAIKKELLDKTNGFSNILPQHHNYDNLISIQSIEHGYENIVIPFGFSHLGGRTDVGEDWTQGTGKTKQDIHTEAHPPLYEYGRGKLPIAIEDIYDEDNKLYGYNLYMDRKLVKTKIYD